MSCGGRISKEVSSHIHKAWIAFTRLKHARYQSACTVAMNTMLL